jgi:hypothetical protein
VGALRSHTTAKYLVVHNSNPSGAFPDLSPNAALQFGHDRHAHGPGDPTDSASAVVPYTPRVVPIRAPSKRMCRAGLPYLLGSDRVVAEFSLPGTTSGTVVRWMNGAAHTYRFPRCYRVWWTDQSAACSDGGWVQNRTAQVGRDDARHGDANTDQPFLKVTYP